MSPSLEENLLVFEHQAHVNNIPLDNGSYVPARKMRKWPLFLVVPLEPVSFILKANTEKFEAGAKPEGSGRESQPLPPKG